MSGLFGGLHGWFNWLGGWVLQFLVGKIAWRTTTRARWVRLLFGSATVGVFIWITVFSICMVFQFEASDAAGGILAIPVCVLVAMLIEWLYLTLSTNEEILTQGQAVKSE